MWKLKSYLRPYWLWSVLAPLMMMLEVFMDLLQPTLMASIVDHGIMTKDLSHLDFRMNWNGVIEDVRTKN
ncbi:MAG TPA: hypothetical protein DEA91_17270 [Paenibacillus sp.]|nr:hypothetical protein [Paenibacillus sp.]